MTHPLFSLNIPDSFEIKIEKHSSLRFENEAENYDFQAPFISVSLFPIQHIEEQKGSAFIEKYIRWSKGFKSEVQSSKEIDFKGYSCFIVEAKTDASFQDQHFKINYFNACILLDENWCVDVQAVYEIKDELVYRSLFEACFQSLEILGNAENWETAYSKDVAESQKAYEEHASVIASEEMADKLEAPAFLIPEDGQEYIRIGSFDFEFIEEACKWNTVEFSQKFYVQIQARTSQIQEAKEKGLLGYAYQLEEGEIQLSFDCAEIYQQGIPTAEFLFEEGKTGAPHFMHFRNNGIDLDFYGRISLKQGYIGIMGIFRKPYQDEPFFPISVCKKLPTEGIDWSLYQFNLKEALQTPPENVQSLWIKEYLKADFPQEIFAFTKLKQLRIQSNSNRGGAGTKALKNIPHEIGQLKELRELSICNTSIEKLPDSLGDLKSLERLQLMNNQLSELPVSIFSLSKLVYLWVSNNQLVEIPQNINLAELQQADLSKNQLKSLPESLALQGKLTKLRLDGNPWESLPDAFNRIENIDLDIDDKRRLLAYDYQGADGRGTNAWKEEPYFARHDPKLMNYLRKATEHTVLEKYRPALEKLALKTVCINTTEADEYKTLGNSRFGGLPDLPKGEDYPIWHADFDGEEHHYIFIAQLNCEELAPYQDYLPAKGILYFYLEEEESFGCKVVYHPNSDDLETAKSIKTEDLNIFDMDEPYSPHKAEYSPCVGLPSFYSDDYWYELIEAPELENLEDYDHPDYKAFSETDRDSFRKALGKKGRFQEWNNTYYPDSHHSLNDYVFTQHESPQEQAALKFKGNPEDWVVLLKVYSDNKCGFCFWDAGELFFVIHKSDLAKADFSKVYASIETS